MAQIVLLYAILELLTEREQQSKRDIRLRESNRLFYGHSQVSETAQILFFPPSVPVQPTQPLFGLRCAHQEYLMFTDYEPEAGSAASLVFPACTSVCICCQTDVTLKSLTFFSHISFSKRDRMSCQGLKACAFLLMDETLLIVPAFQLPYPLAPQ